MLLRCDKNFILYKIWLIIFLLLTTVHKLFTLAASLYLFHYIMKSENLNLIRMPLESITKSKDEWLTVIKYKNFNSCSYFILHFWIPGYKTTAVHLTLNLPSYDETK